MLYFVVYNSLDIPIYTTFDEAEADVVAYMEDGYWKVRALDSWSMEEY